MLSSNKPVRQPSRPWPLVMMLMTNVSIGAVDDDLSRRDFLIPGTSVQPYELELRALLQFDVPTAREWRGRDNATPQFGFYAKLLRASTAGKCWASGMAGKVNEDPSEPVLPPAFSYRCTRGSIEVYWKSIVVHSLCLGSPPTRQ